jgi:hypothetical protein
MEDVEFTFSPASFINGIKELLSGLTNFESKAKDVGTKADSELNKAGKNIGTVNSKVNDVSKKKGLFSSLFGGAEKSSVNLLGNLLKIGAIVGVIVGGFKMVSTYIPEIGMAFKIAGDIFGRNLLMPLRRELIPLLLKMLDWVRENRVLFLQMGNVIASVFRVAYRIAADLFMLIKDSIEKTISGLQNIFGTTSMTIEETVNLLLFKISAIAIFIMVTMEPVFGFIVKSFLTMVTWTKAFFDGFVVGFGGVMPLVQNFIDTLQSIIKSFDQIGIRGDKVTNIFKKMGEIVGTVVKIQLNTLLQLLDSVGLGLGLIVNNVQKLNALRKGEDTSKFDKRNQELLSGYKERSVERLQIVKSSPDEPYSRNTYNESNVGNIYNEPTPEVNNKQLQNNYNNNITIPISVSEEKLKDVRKEVGNGLKDALRDQLEGEGEF